MTSGSVDLSKYNNAWYKPGGVLRRVFWYMFSYAFFKSGFPFNSFKVGVLRLFGAEVGKGVIIKPAVNIKYPWKLKVGNHVWLGEQVWIDNLGLVVIGDHCCLSQGAMLLCGNHDYRKSSFDLMTGDITLDKGVWIGARAVVCPGVFCGSHSILTVGSVVTAAMEAYGIYQGNPAVKVKERVVAI